MLVFGQILRGGTTHRLRVLGAVEQPLSPAFFYPKAARGSPASRPSHSFASLLRSCLRLSARPMPRRCQEFALQLLRGPLAHVGTEGGLRAGKAEQQERLRGGDGGSTKGGAK